MRLRFQLRPSQNAAPYDYPNIRIGALRLFAREHCNGKINGGWAIASWHHQKSITWRWFLYWGPWNRNKECKKIGGWSGPNGHGNKWLIIPVIGRFEISWQQSMWRKPVDKGVNC